MIVTLVFIHGWVEQPGIWDGIASRLDDFEQIRLDLGFFSDSLDELTNGKSLPENAVLIGHSLGFAQGLHLYNQQFVAGISINGFPRFTSSQDGYSGVAPRVLNRMQKTFSTDPVGVTTNFLNRCGQNEPDLAGLNSSRAEWGLSQLAELDLRTAISNPVEFPILALASKDDPIVSEEMSQAAFQGHDLHFTPDGGHMLPQSQPGWCSDKIREFILAHD